MAEATYDVPHDYDHFQIPARVLTTSGVTTVSRPKGTLRRFAYYFANIDNTDTWASPFTGDPRVIGWAWSHVSGAGTTSVACAPSTGVFTFTCAVADNNVGWLIVWAQ